jgi:hypothetical protein
MRMNLMFPEELMALNETRQNTAAVVVASLELMMALFLLSSRRCLGEM